MERSAGCARCGLSASPGHRGWDELCSCTRRKRCCRMPRPYSRVRPLASTGSAGWWRRTGWRGWSNWGSASPAASGGPRRNSSCYLAATVANLTLVAAKASLLANTGCGSSAGSPFRTSIDFVPARLAQILTLALLTSATLSKCSLINKAFRPDF